MNKPNFPNTQMNQTNQKGLIRGVTYDPLLTDVMDKLSHLEGQLNRGEIVFAEFYRRIGNLLAKAYSKPRRAIVISSLMTMPDNQLDVVHFMDDGDTKVEEGIVNIKGPWTITIIEIDGHRTSWVMITFSNNGNPVNKVVNTDKMRRSNIYDSFLADGFIFNQKIRKEKMGEILFSTFSRAIKQTTYYLSISSLSGWCEKRYMHRHNFAFGNVKEFFDFPVLSAEVIQGELNCDVIDDYSSMLIKIEDEDERMLIAMYPFLSSIASLFPEEQQKECPFLNFVLEENSSAMDLVKYMKITDRGTDALIDVTLAPMKLAQSCSAVKDDVLILDARLDGLASYDKKKVNGNLSRILQGLAGERALASKQSAKGCVIISDSFLFEENVLNFTWSVPKTAGKKSFKDSFAMLYAGFIGYVEDNYDTVVSRIANHKSKNSEKAKMFEITLILFLDFCRSKNYLGKSILKFEKIPDFEKSLTRSCLDKDSLIDYFYDSMRAEAKNLFFKPVHFHDSVENTILFDDRFFWISTEVFREILAKHGLKKHLRFILEILKEENVLKTTAAKGLSIRRFNQEYYKISRTFFNRVGDVDIRALSEKGGEFNDR